MKRLSLLIVLIIVALSGFAQAAQPPGQLTFTFTPATQQKTGKVDLWFPYPVSDEFQTISNMSVTGNFDSSTIYRDPHSEALYGHAVWEKPAKAPTCVMQFHISQKDRRNTDIQDSGKDFPKIVAPYLMATAEVPANDPEMKKIADQATKGKKGTLEKARAVYDWVVENTFRNPEVKGCGLAIPGRTLEQCKGGGKCADLSAVFVTLARAAGIPARDVYGLRLGSPKTGNVTSGFHCWAEFYLPGTGWVMVDPADVRKMMLVHKLEKPGKWYEFFWGGDDLFRLVLEKNSRSVHLNGLDKPLNYFMYPAARVDGTMLNYFDAKNFSYKVEFTKD